MTHRHREVHPIEAESYRILRSRVDTSALPRWTRTVVERVVHTSADVGYVDDLVCRESDLERAAMLLRDEVPVVVDAEMVAAGVTGYDTRCFVRDRRTRELAEETGRTRSAAAVHVALGEVPPGAVWVVGNAPTFLFELLDLAGRAQPSLVVGLPVGFVGAAESKHALRESGLPAVTNRTEKGGSAVAAATLNALLYGSPI
ncbi:MAG: precorrin-8X methylmutase [Actinomycetota bacterium]|nr:precorrin-8X methylmutase [Actinomycetota bacterium]